MHIALQGCLRATNVEYGLTADTGGHIKYLLELVEAAEAAGATRQDVVVRRFEDERIGAIYGEREERISARSRILRIDGDTTRYLAKEALWPELATIARNLVDEIAAMDEVPDVIHAHYADAGWVGAEIRERLGIPLVFTAHSLGRVKLAVTGGKADPALRRRIAIEERAIAAADRIVTSSHDEACGQYGLYESFDPRRVKVNPPGCDLDAFRLPRGNAAADARLEADLARFLADPSKPPLLALARPVAKKNLLGLVEAYGACPELRARANLVVFAGTRDDLADEEPENAAVLRELVLAVDRLDLWGSIAMPKRHEPHQVPAIYEWARVRGGIFVNTALNEPFGLTFLEAAAAGLPVVATHSGGPNDIVANLRHGVLVDPTVPEETSRACLAMLEDPERRASYGRQGRARVGYYAWSRHAQDYLSDMGTLRVVETRHTHKNELSTNQPLVEGMSRATASLTPVSQDASVASPIRVAAPRT